ncbi:hypothetical protein CPB83DRAFT_896727, partial [Crepidotus variabilis]
YVNEQFDQLYERIAALELRLSEVSVPQVPTAPPAPTIAAITSKPSRRARKKASAPVSAPPVSIPAHPPLSGSFPKEDPHLVGKGGRGLKQIHDLSGAHIRAFEVKDGSVGARHVSIRGSDSQVGDALVVLGKRLARRRVRAPQQKSTKGSSRVKPSVPPLATSGLVGPGAAKSAAPLPATQAPPLLKSTTPAWAHPLASSTPVAHSTPPPAPSIVMQTAAPPSLVPTPGARSTARTPRTMPNTPIVPTVAMPTTDSTPGPSYPSSPMNIDALMARHQGTLPASSTSDVVQRSPQQAS